MILRCSTCDNLVMSPPGNMGDVCGKNGCWGRLAFFANTLVVGPSERRVKCKVCGNVYNSGPGRRIFDRCNVNGCIGELDRFWG